MKPREKLNQKQTWEIDRTFLYFIEYTELPKA